MHMIHDKEKELTVVDRFLSGHEERQFETSVESTKVEHGVLTAFSPKEVEDEPLKSSNETRDFDSFRPTSRR